MRTRYGAQHPGGRAIIIDLRKDASWEEIEAYVNGLKVGRLDAWLTRMAFKDTLLKRAYTEKDMESLAKASNFRFFAIAGTPVGMEVTLVRREPIAERAA